MTDGLLLSFQLSSVDDNARPSPCVPHSPQPLNLSAPPGVPPAEHICLSSAFRHPQELRADSYQEHEGEVEAKLTCRRLRLFYHLGGRCCCCSRSHYLRSLDLRGLCSIPQDSCLMVTAVI